MTVLKCKMCGGTLELKNENCKVVTCEYCNTTQTVPILDNEKKSPKLKKISYRFSIFLVFSPNDTFTLLTYLINEIK